MLPYKARVLDRQGDLISIAEVVKAAAGNKWEDAMAQLLGRRENQITITEEVVKAAARNRGNGDEVTTMLLDRGDKLIITEKILSIIAR